MQCARFSVWICAVLFLIGGWAAQGWVVGQDQVRSDAQSGSSATMAVDPSFRYDAQRDPFATRAQPDATVPTVSEVVILGIFRRGETYCALVRGGGLQNARIVCAGQKLLDGDVLHVGPMRGEPGSEIRSCVVFRVATKDPLRPFVRVVKCLQR